MCVGGGGGQDVITIQKSTMTAPSATVSRVSTARGVGVWGSGYKCILILTARVGVCVRSITMEMCTDVK